MDIITVIIFLGIVQGIFLGILLLTIKRGNRKTNRLLGVLMILFSFSITGFLLIRTSQYSRFPFLIGFPSTVIFLFGPVFYFYVKALTEKDFLFQKKDLLHLIPFVILILYKIPFFVSNTWDKLSTINDYSSFSSNQIILIFQIIHLSVYLFFINKIQRAHEIKIKATMSSIEKINLRWIKFSINSFLAVFGILAIFIVLFFFGETYYYHFITIIPLLVSIIILAMGFWGLEQPIIFSPEEENSKVKRYEKSTLTKIKADEYLDKLIKIMEGEKPFLESNLTLQKLADALNIPPHHLSQIINERTNQNFFDFINGYRIEEAKLLLCDPRGDILTILAIAEEVGFNSKSSFNVAFKKYTSMTPTQYKKTVASQKTIN